MHVVYNFGHFWWTRKFRPTSIFFVTFVVCAGYIQERDSDSMSGWATFGIISCMYVCLEL
jgi:hypothetical protein